MVIGNTIKFTNGYKMAEASASNSTLMFKEGIQDATAIGTEIVQSDNQVNYTERPSIGENIGELYIPKLGAVLPIIHGTNEDELEKGVGRSEENAYELQSREKLVCRLLLEKKKHTR